MESMKQLGKRVFVLPRYWAHGGEIGPNSLSQIALLRVFGCYCDLPLLGWIDNKGPRCRLCNTEARLPYYGFVIVATELDKNRYSDRTFGAKYDGESCPGCEDNPAAKLDWCPYALEMGAEGTEARCHCCDDCRHQCYEDS